MIPEIIPINRVQLILGPYTHHNENIRLPKMYLVGGTSDKMKSYLALDLLQTILDLGNLSLYNTCVNYVPHFGKQCNIYFWILKSFSLL